LAPTASAEILQVPRQHLSIQSALDAAQSGDTVLVAPGIYEGPANRNLDFRGKALSVIARAGPSATVLDCGGRGRGFRFRSGEDASCLVRGFTIKDGRALGFGAAGKGGGIYCAGSSPRVEDCVILSCEAQFGGGLGAEWDARPLLAGCVFRSNRARLDGGGLYLSGGGGMLRDCRLLANRAGEKGPDALFLDSGPRLLRCGFDTPPVRYAPAAALP